MLEDVGHPFLYRGVLSEKVVYRFGVLRFEAVRPKRVIFAQRIAIAVKNAVAAKLDVLVGHDVAIVFRHLPDLV